MSSRRLRPGRGFIVATTLWGLGIVAGMAALFVYQVTPGAAAEAPPDWPDAVSLEPASDSPTLVMIAHPRCSCTRASMTELAWLMTRLQGKLRSYVVVERPDGVDADFDDTELVRYAGEIDGVTVVRDPGGVIADAFGARTSGQTYLFDTQQRLVFEGGVTPTRAHQGDNVGRRRIVALVEDGHAERTTSVVFGCDLRDVTSEEFVGRQWR